MSGDLFIFVSALVLDTFFLGYLCGLVVGYIRKPLP